MAMSSKRSCVLFVITLLAIFALAEKSFAATITVPGDQPTIQDALNAATSGDIIEIAAGARSLKITSSSRAVWT